MRRPASRAGLDPNQTGLDPKQTAQSNKTAQEEQKQTPRQKEAQEALEAALLEARATVLEYEHALEHVADPHDAQSFCPDCQSLAQGALAGRNRDMCREMAAELGVTL